MTCDGMDVIAKNIEVPKNLTVSDWLCFSGMGAYTYGSKSTFNGMKATDKVIRFVASVHKETEVSSLYRE
jgi:diaminopimelate decarboxylase